MAEDSITDVEVRDLTPEQQAPIPLAKPPIGKRTWRMVTAHGDQATVIAAAGGAATLLLGLHLLISQQQALQQERNLVLLGQLRQSQDSSASAGSARTATETQQAELLPPAPPTEPWMEELAKLPPSGPSSDNLLKVPLHGPLATASLPSPVAGANPESIATSLPQLVGIIQGAGKSGSAIFQTGGSSTNVAAGETIGSSGWRLRTTSGDSAIIERGGQQRRISISQN